MSKTDKLLKKLQNGTISADEARTLLKKMGWEMDRQRGSHETWTNNIKTLILSPHTKELKSYQIKQIQKALEEK